MAAARAQRAAAEANLGRAEESLGLLVAADGPVGALLDQPPPPPPPDEALAGADRRQDVRTAQVRLGAARNLVRDGWTDYLPILVGSFAPFYQNPPSLVQPLTGWQAQLVLSLPLYDGGLRYGLRRERAAVAEQARVSLEGTLRQARAEVRSAALALRHGDEALAAARDSARLAEEARALAELAYRAGATTSLELFDAERRARDAATQATLAEDAARQARLDLLAAGGRWP